MSDAVDHPAHYGAEDDPYEVIKVLDAWNLSFCLGNTVKYIARHDKKGAALEDLKKARWYLGHEIERMEAGVRSRYDVLIDLGRAYAEANPDAQLDLEEELKRTSDDGGIERTLVAAEWAAIRAEFQVHVDWVASDRLQKAVDQALDHTGHSPDIEAEKDNFLVGRNAALFRMANVLGVSPGQAWKRLGELRGALPRLKGKDPRDTFSACQLARPILERILLHMDEDGSVDAEGVPCQTDLKDALDACDRAIKRVMGTDAAKGDDDLLTIGDIAEVFPDRGYEVKLHGSGSGTTIIVYSGNVAILIIRSLLYGLGYVATVIVGELYGDELEVRPGGWGVSDWIDDALLRSGHPCWRRKTER